MINHEHNATKSTNRLFSSTYGPSGRRNATILQNVAFFLLKTQDLHEMHHRRKETRATISSKATEEPEQARNRRPGEICTLS